MRSVLSSVLEQTDQHKRAGTVTTEVSAGNAAAPRQPGVVDELMEEAHKLPALQIKPPTPQAAADPTPPISTSKALVAEVASSLLQRLFAIGDRQ